MRTGRLSISRGHQAEESAPAAPRLALVPSLRPEAKPESVPAPAAPAAPALPALPEYHGVHDRLTALERLARLHLQGALSAAEFAAEKMLVLNLPVDELVLHPSPPLAVVAAAPPRPERGPSLLGRLFSWWILPVGLAAGLGLSFASQPQETIRFFDEALRLFGA